MQTGHDVSGWPLGVQRADISCLFPSGSAVISKRRRWQCSLLWTSASDGPGHVEQASFCE